MKTLCLILFLILTTLAVNAQQPTTEDKGEITTTYDRRANKTTTEFLIMLDGNKANGLGLMGMFVYDGQRLTKPALATLGLVSFAAARRHEKTEGGYFLIDGKRKDFTLTYTPMSVPDGGIAIEVLSISSEFSYDEIVKLTKAKSVGVYLEGKEFKFTEKHLDLLREFARRMKGEAPKELL